jgi:hypothetical protein
MCTTDVQNKEWVNANASFMHWLAPFCGALLVVIVGKWQAARVRAKTAPVIDLADDVNKSL